MRRPHILTTDRLVGVAIALGATFIFALDMTPIRGAADGASYGLIVALAAYVGRRAILTAAIVGAFLTIVGPLLGAEGGETLLQIVSGRLFGLAVIGLLTVVLLHLLKANEVSAQSDREIATYERALRKMTRLALSADKSLLERLEIITEMTVGALNLDRACVARVEETGARFRLYDVWDRRLAKHLHDREPPACYEAEFQELMTNDFVSVTSDIHQSPLYRDALSFYDERHMVAVLHAAAPYREKMVGSLIVSHGRPYRFSEREIAFAKSAAQIVALIFALHHSERTLDRLDRVSQGIFVIGTDGVVEYANLAAKQIAGVNAADAPPAVPFALPPLLTERDRHQITHEGREYEIHRVRLPEAETIIRIDDVTARNAAMAEARRMEQRLKESAKLQAMGQMAAGVAHDFNNILSAITGFTQVLARMLEGRPAEYNFADRILGVCRRGKALTEEILGFARTASVERREIDLSQLLGNDFDLVPGEVQLTVVPPDENLPVAGNSAQLLQLIQNLVVNAMHACEDSAGCVVVSAGRANSAELQELLDMSAEHRLESMVGAIDPARDYCFLRVADNGQGIAPEIMEHIFEPFFTTKGRNKGSGLGLVVVHGVVDSHDGCCHVRSEPGKGTVFTIYLPLLSEAAIAAAE